MPAISINNFLNTEFVTLDFKGEFYQAFGNPEATGVWFIWGNSGNGKSAFTLQLCKEIFRAMREIPNRKAAKGAFVSLEEGKAKTVQNSFKREGMGALGRGFKLIVNETMEQISERLTKEKNLRFVVFDSFQYTKMDFKEYLEFKKKHSDKLLIFTSQTIGKLPKGRAADDVYYDASLKIWVQGFKAFSKGRYIGPTGEYTIWKERANVIHGIN